MAGAHRTRGRVIVFGILFHFPLAGVTYQFLHYLLALRRLGWDPYYVEDTGRWPYDPQSATLVEDPTRNIAAVLPALTAHGFADRWAFRTRYGEDRCYGLSPLQLRALYGNAVAMLNVTASQEITDELRTDARRVYVESDPVGSQVRVSQGDPRMKAVLDAHHVHFTFGENVGAADCPLPAEHVRWLPTRQPVVLDLWLPVATPARTYTTVAGWHSDYKVVYRDETYYWTKDREFMKVLDLPRRRPLAFEIAADVGDDDAQRLREQGWQLTSAAEVSRDLIRYRQYIANSRAEFTVAKDQYVRLRTGWFSDRSACYLAAGRPVITQDTAFGSVLPTGRGLFAFQDLDDIVDALDTIETDYEGNRRAAREIAHEYFDAEKVVGALLERAGL